MFFFIFDAFFSKVSSTTIKNYNICDKTLKDITDSNGFISSANYPNYNTYVTIIAKQ